MSEILGNRRILDRARISRDARFDGKFFIAVTSTGIYCRPICPARTVKASNARYYATAAAATEAGYRPCLRCRPEAAPGTPAWLGTSAVVRRAMRLIDEGALDDGSVEELAATLGVGARHLHRLFVRHVGASPNTVAQTRRLHFAKKLLDETNLPITEIALAAGYGSVRRFNSAFKETYARSPREMRRKPFEAEGGEIVLRLAFRPPYDWNQVCDFLAARAIAGVEYVDANGYSRSVVTEHGQGIVCVRPVEDKDALELRVRGIPPRALYQLSATVRRVFDLAADPERIARTFKSDALIGPLIKQRPGLRIPGAWDGFECAVRAIAGQQVSVAAARTLLGRLVARAGKPLHSVEGSVTHLFPTASELARADLAGLGLTTSRVAALQELARAVVTGSVSFDAPAEEVSAALTNLPGVGAWTCQYIALRALNEPDAFPSGDLVLRSIAASNGHPLSASALERRAQAWRPWRAYAAMHLWREASEAERRRSVA